MKMHEIAVLTAATCMMALGSQSALGQEVQPVADRGDKVEHVEPRGGDAGPARAMARAGARAAQPSEEDVAETMTFMREHSPNRVKAMENLPEEGAAQRRVLPFMVARYRALQAVKDEDPQLYDLNVKQIEIEDELYGLVASARRIGEREKLHDRIRAVVKRQEETNFAEREHRLNRLRESLRREEKKLADDRAQIDGLADSRTGELIQQGPAALRRDGLRREEARRDGRPTGATSKGVEK